VSSDYLSHVAHPRTAVFHLGHDMEAFDAAWSPEWKGQVKLEGERWIVYVGTVSLNYDLSVVLEVASRFPRDVFWILGDGEALPALRAAASASRLDNVRLPGRMPYGELANLIARADVGLLGLNALARVRFPYKTFDYLAAGLKVVTSIGAGELHDLIATERLGEFYVEGDAPSLAKALTDALDAATPGEKERIRTLGRSRYSSRVIYERYVDFLESLAR
jgi:hypothetical protein